MLLEERLSELIKSKSEEQAHEQIVKEIVSVFNDILFDCEKGKQTWVEGLRQMKSEFDAENHYDTVLKTEARFRTTEVYNIYNKKGELINNEELEDIAVGYADFMIERDSKTSILDCDFMDELLDEYLKENYPDYYKSDEPRDEEDYDDEDEDNEDEE